MIIKASLNIWNQVFDYTIRSLQWRILKIYVTLHELIRSGHDLECLFLQ